MNTIHDVLRQHVGNADSTLIPLVECFIFAQAADWLTEQLRQSLETERAAIAGYEAMGDNETVRYIESECAKLERLIADLGSVGPPTEDEIKRMIENRYMATPIDCA